jgi:hypothetical protein
VTAGLARRLSKLEERAHDDWQRRWVAALRVLGPTLAPEHREMLAAWSACPDVRAEFHLRPRDTLLGRVLRLRPPALVRAAMILVATHVARGTPLTLPDYVARVYVEDPLALPLLACDGCGYGLPIRGRTLADGRIE